MASWSASLVLGSCMAFWSASGLMPPIILCTISGLRPRVAQGRDGAAVKGLRIAVQVRLDIMLGGVLSVAGSL